MSTAWEWIAGREELAAGERKSVFVDDTPALLVRTADGYWVIEDLCTHDGQPLTDGPIHDHAIACPRHGARFDLRTGQALCMPATEAVTTFAVEVRDDGIYAAPRGAVSAESQPTISAASEVVATANSTTASAEQAGVESGSPVASTETSEPSEEVSDADLIDALRQVIDPELMVNIVDLGLVYSVNQSERKVVVEMTLTSPACPAGPQIIQQAKMVLERLAAIDEAQIKLTMSPPWTPDRMTDEARDQLGFF